LIAEARIARAASLLLRQLLLACVLVPAG